MLGRSLNLQHFLLSASVHHYRDQGSLITATKEFPLSIHVKYVLSIDADVVLTRIIPPD
jgi:hypothetical protein